jgi:hypothetical protein
MQATAKVMIAFTRNAPVTMHYKIGSVHVLHALETSVRRVRVQQIAPMYRLHLILATIFLKLAPRRPQISAPTKRLGCLARAARAVSARDRSMARFRPKLAAYRCYLFAETQWPDR